MRYRVEISLNRVDNNGNIGLICCYVTGLLNNFKKAEKVYDQLMGCIQVEKVRKQSKEVEG